MKKRTLTGAGCGHYVTFSVMGRRALLASPRARQIVISHLGKLAEAGRVKVSGFVIMPDHVHAVLWFDDDDNKLPELMRTWKAQSARSLRTFYEAEDPGTISRLMVTRSGRRCMSFWQRRYYDFNLFNPDKIREKLQYLHNNPVKKGLCAKPEDWIWSSARWYAESRRVGVKIVPGF